MKALLLTASALSSLLWQIEASAFGPKIGAWNILGRNSISGEINTAEISCRDGIKPGGGSFTMLGIISVKNSSLKNRTPSGLEYRGVNGSLVPSYQMTINEVFECKDLPEALKSGKDIPVAGVQTIAEVYQRHADGVCEKTLSERIVIDMGGYKLTGSTSMTVFPIDAINCESIDK